MAEEWAQKCISNFMKLLYHIPPFICDLLETTLLTLLPETWNSSYSFFCVLPRLILCIHRRFTNQAPILKPKSLSSLAATAASIRLSNRINWKKTLVKIGIPEQDTPNLTFSDPWEKWQALNQLALKWGLLLISQGHK